MADKDIVRIYRKPAGPIVVTGKVELLDDDNNVIDHKSKFSLCGCGLSKKLPFCDGTHKQKKQNSQSVDE